MFNSLYFMGFILLIITFMMAAIPYLTRKSEQFGVAIPQSVYNRDDIAKMRRQYATYIVMTGITLTITQVILTFFVSELIAIIVFNVIVFGFLFASFFLYLPFHRKMKAIKRSEKWTESRKQTTVISTSFREDNIVISNWLFLIPFIITIISVLVTFLLYDKIPNEIPMHTSFSGEVRYDEKNVFNLLLMPGMNLFMIGLFMFINNMIKHSKQQVNAENPKVSKVQNILYRRKWSRYLFVMLLLTVAMFTFVQMAFIFPSLQPYEEIVMLTIIGFIFITTIVLSFKTGQGGSRIKIDDELNETVMDKDEDQYWKLGQFYFNKNDPAIFVEKRFGVGWTNNWAHPISWIFIVLIIGLAVGIPLLLTYL
ncbi:MAG TPA: DUF5808 domain-containing protein [Pseudogracilibacillus sp.]|nr:DUF5808 domain-containing protein [Pseudogracilibacillus sp.]